jgi:hypothetical protein
MDMGKVTRNTGLPFARVRFLLMMSTSIAARAATMVYHVSLTNISELLITIIIGLSDPNILIDLALPITTGGEVAMRRSRNAGHARGTVAGMGIESLHLAPWDSIKGVQRRLPPNKPGTFKGGALITASAPIMRHERACRSRVV